MEGKGTNNKPESKKNDNIEVEVFGLADFHLVSGAYDRATGKNVVDVKIKKGEKAMVPKSFVDGLKRNKVIK